jgi:hypothetical protein
MCLGKSVAVKYRLPSGIPRVICIDVMKSGVIKNFYTNETIDLKLKMAESLK